MRRRNSAQNPRIAPYDRSLLCGSDQIKVEKLRAAVNVSTAARNKRNPVDSLQAG